MSKRKTSAAHEESQFISNKRNKTFYQHESKTIDFTPIRAPRTAVRPVVMVPKTLNQEKYIIALLDDSIDIVVVSGPAGVGKTYLCVLAAIKALKARQCDHIVLTRPAVGADEENHGFLPGTLDQKMMPWLTPLFDVFAEYYSTKEIEGMLADKIIEIAPLGFMRGRTFKRSWIIGDEMQNASKNQILMLLTRIGEGSKIVVTGDLYQRDRKFYQDNGLVDLFKRLDEANSKSIMHVELERKDVQRHRIVSEVLALYGEE